MTRQEAAMPVAQVIDFNERQLMGRSRRAPQQPAPCVVLQFPPAAHRTPASAMPMKAGDDDAFPGRGRDPG
jgi:hypothetical protein